MKISIDLAMQHPHALIGGRVAKQTCHALQCHRGNVVFEPGVGPWTTSHGPSQTMVWSGCLDRHLPRRTAEFETQMDPQQGGHGHGAGHTSVITELLHIITQLCASTTHNLRLQRTAGRDPQRIICI